MVYTICPMTFQAFFVFWDSLGFGSHTSWKKYCIFEIDLIKIALFLLLMHQLAFIINEIIIIDHFCKEWLLAPLDFFRTITLIVMLQVSTDWKRFQSSFFYILILSSQHFFRFCHTHVFGQDQCSKFWYSMANFSFLKIKLVYFSVSIKGEGLSVFSSVEK